MKKIIVSLLLLSTLALLGTAFSAEKIILGVALFPHKEIATVMKPILAKEGYDLVIKEFTDYIQPNMALAEKELNANFFQHIPFLENTNRERKLGLKWVAKVHFPPLGIYSRKIKKLSELNKGDRIAIPSDPTNSARALKLLQQAGLIKVKKGELLTVRDITENPKGLKIIELDASQLPRTLDDTTASVINTNFAVEAGLVPLRDAIFLESKDSPYINVLVVREADKNSKITKALVKAINSPQVRKFIESELSKKGILPVF